MRVDFDLCYSVINKRVAVCVRVIVELSSVSSSHIVGRRGCKTISKEEGGNRLVSSSSRNC